MKRTSFPPRDIRKNPRSMYARVPQSMAQFVLKIEKLSHIMGTAPNSRISARLRFPSPIMAPGPNRKYAGGNWIAQEGCYIGAAESMGYTPKMWQFEN